MSRADKIFVSNVKEILATGFSDSNLDVRPHWEDGTPAHTIKKFGIVNRYNIMTEYHFHRTVCYRMGVGECH